jgi:hypothetical protein
LRVTTVVVLTLLFSLFVFVRSISSQVLSALPWYAPIIERLPGYGPQEGDPIYLHAGSRVPAHVDTAAMRRAGRLVPDEATYFVQAPRSNPTALEIVRAARLFFMPAPPSRRAATADWILSYRSRSLPKGLRAARIYRLNDDLLLVELQRR